MHSWNNKATSVVWRKFRIDSVVVGPVKLTSCGSFRDVQYYLKKRYAGYTVVLFWIAKPLENSPG